MGDMTTSGHREGADVRITQREIYDQVIDLAGIVRDTSTKVDNLLALFAEQGRRVGEHEARIVVLELAGAGHATVAATVATHGGQLAELRSRIDRSSWAPALIASIIPTVIGALAVYAIIPK